MREIIEINIACDKYNDFSEIVSSILDYNITQDSYQKFSIDNWRWSNKTEITNDVALSILNNKIVVFDNLLINQKQCGGYQYIDSKMFINVLWLEYGFVHEKEYDCFVSKIEKTLNYQKDQIGLLYACVGVEMYIENSNDFSSLVETSSGVDKWIFP